MQDTYAVFKDPAADDNPLGFVSRFDAASEAIHTEENLEGANPVKRVEKRKRETMSSPLGELSPNEVLAPKQRRAASGMKLAEAASEKAAALRKKSFPDNLPESLDFYSSQVIAHQKRCHQPPVVHGSWCSCAVCTKGELTEGASEEPVPSAFTAQKAKPHTSKKSILQASTSVSQQALRALESRNPLKRVRNPLEIYNLSSMSGDRKSQNKRGDYFAVVEWVDNKTIKRFCMSMKRDLRIVDPSTEKKVLLSEKDCKSFDWFIPNPVGIDGCDVEAMREWWGERQEKEREKRKLEGQVKETMDGKVLAPLCHRGCFRGPDWTQVLELEALDMLAEAEDDDDLKHDES